MNLPYNIKVVSKPKHAPKEALENTEEHTVYGLIKARDKIVEIRKYHQANSAYFRIYSQGLLIFDSSLIHH